MAKSRDIRERLSETDDKLIDKVRSVWGPLVLTREDQVGFDDRLKKRIKQRIDANPWRRWVFAAVTAGILLMSVLIIVQAAKRTDSRFDLADSSEVAMELKNASWVDWMDAVLEPQDEKRLVAFLGVEYQALNEMLTTYQTAE